MTVRTMNGIACLPELWMFHHWRFSNGQTFDQYGIKTPALGWGLDQKTSDVPSILLCMQDPSFGVFSLILKHSVFGWQALTSHCLFCNCLNPANYAIKIPSQDYLLNLLIFQICSFLFRILSFIDIFPPQFCLQHQSLLILSYKEKINQLCKLIFFISFLKGLAHLRALDDCTK